MYNREKCYSCERYLKDCVPQHDIDPRDCKDYKPKFNPSKRDLEVG